MKKTILFLLTVLLFACSNDDSESPNENSILLKKVVNGNQVSTISYSGNKILEVTFSGNSSKEVYTYSGDFITDIRYINTNSNIIEYRNSYIYENGQLKTLAKFGGPSGNEETRFIYTYNADGTVSYTKTDITNTILGNIYRGNGVLTFTNGVVTKDEFFNVGYPENTNVYSTGYVYEYDNKNSAFKNVTGFDKFLQQDFRNSKFNLTKQYQFTKLLNNGVLTTSNDNPEVISIYTYNELNFPIERKLYEGNNTLSGTTQFSY